mmetsp:Transcript_4690/g.12258  ORF Transcript_4690/g.12258 Transcript_4690/m.12258 type:complete len:100 (-) Transcript_4690:712-1011(-)
MRIGIDRSMGGPSSFRISQRATTDMHHRVFSWKARASEVLDRHLRERRQGRTEREATNAIHSSSSSPLLSQSSHSPPTRFHVPLQLLAGYQIPFLLFDF